MVANNPQLLAERSVGGVLTSLDLVTNTSDHLDTIEVYAHGDHVVTFSAISTDSLFGQWLADMVTSGYALPQRQNHSGTDRSQQDLDVRAIVKSCVWADHAAARSWRSPSTNLTPRMISARWFDPSSFLHFL